MVADDLSRRELLASAPAAALVLAGCTDSSGSDPSDDESPVGYGNRTGGDDDAAGGDDGADDGSDAPDGGSGGGPSSGGGPPALGGGAGSDSGLEPDTYGAGYGLDPYGHPE